MYNQVALTSTFKPVNLNFCNNSNYQVLLRNETPTSRSFLSTGFSNTENINYNSVQNNVASVSNYQSYTGSNNEVSSVTNFPETESKNSTFENEDC